MVNNRMRLKSKEKWVINSVILNSIFERTGGNPRDVIRILKCLVDEKRDLGYQGTLENLVSSQVKKEPVVVEKNYVETKDSRDDYRSQPETYIPENTEIDFEEGDSIDEEPSDLWDFSDEESLIPPENLSEDNIELTNDDTSLWADNFPEIDEDLVDDETFIPEENPMTNLSPPSEDINFQNEIV